MRPLEVPGDFFARLEGAVAFRLFADRGDPTLTVPEQVAAIWTSPAGVVVMVLTAAGLTDVRILDGGLPAWVSAGGLLETGPVMREPGDVTVAHTDLYVGARATLTAEQVADGATATVLDARAPDRFRGDTEPVDPVAGHIPGARNLPSGSLLAADGTFLPESEIAARLVACDPGDSVGVYCGSGVTASVVIAALSAAGVQAALFPGSWSQWSAEPDRPVARGDERD